VVDAISPIKHIDVVSIPVLLIHHRDDTAPHEQGTLMKEALRHAGKGHREKTRATAPQGLTGQLIRASLRGIGQLTFHKTASPRLAIPIHSMATRSGSGDS